MSSQLPRIGWIGTGVMGRSMCGHLLAGGYGVTVYNRSPEKATALVEHGAVAVAAPHLVAEKSDVVFTMVGFPEDVESVICGGGGVLEGAAPGTIVVDMTTSTPSLARRLCALGRDRGVQVLDAPVSGGDIGAREARLSIMAGGSADAVSAVMPMFSLMGKTIVRQGESGAGQHAKMANQILIATAMIGVCEALLYGYKAGLNLETLLQSVSGGAAGSWSLTNYAPRMLAGNFDPGFFVDHFVKDMAIALEESRRMKLALPGLALAEQLYRAVQARGHGRSGTHALILALAEMSSLEWNPR